MDAGEVDFRPDVKRNTYWLGLQTDSWGHVWTAGALSNGNLLLRITSAANVPNADVYLDFVEVPSTTRTSAICRAAAARSSRFEVRS